MTSVAKHDITIWKGDAHTISLVIKQDETPVDISTTQWSAKVVSHDRSAGRNTLMSPSVSFTTDGTNGSLTIVFAATDVESLDDVAGFGFQYEVKNDTENKTYLVGFLKVESYV